MRILSSLLAVVVICFGSVSANADEYGDWDKESYPKELVKRPLLLSKSMFEVRFGVASDFVSSDSADALNLKMDFLYGLATRFQMGIETAVATNDFAVNDAAVWAEYSFMPNISGRVGGFVQVPHDPVADELGDAVFGFRVWLPMKFKLGEKAAFVAAPRIGFADGDSILETPLGIQYQLLSSFALTATSGLRTTNFEFDDDQNTWDMPLSAGAVLHFTRKIDLTVEFIFPDVANDSDVRLLMAYFSFRG